MGKIKQHLNEGVITIEEVLEYVEKYQRAMDAFDDAQIDKYYSEEYGDNNIPDLVLCDKKASGHEKEG